MKSYEISKIINEVFEGVERSKIGKILTKETDLIKFPDGEGYRNFAIQTFLTVLSNVFPKDIVGKMEVEDKEKA